MDKSCLHEVKYEIIKWIAPETLLIICGCITSVCFTGYTDHIVRARSQGFCTRIHIAVRKGRGRRGRRGMKGTPWFDADRRLETERTQRSSCKRFMRPVCMAGRR
jgi:hypothetical protein